MEKTDVVIESFRPGVVKRLGIGFDVLSQTNRALVYCPITGYGQDGPYAQRAGHDMNYLGLVGLLGCDVVGRPGRRKATFLQRHCMKVAFLQRRGVRRGVRREGRRGRAGRRTAPR